MARSAAIVLAALATCAAAPAPALALRVSVGTPGADHLRAPRSGGALFGAGGPDTLVGGSGDDRLYGGRSGNRISGRGGDDYIEGGTGSDRISGGTGNNTIFAGSGQDVVRAGDGDNYVDAGGGHDRVTLGNGDNVLVTASGGGTFTVGNGNNTIYYGSGIVDITAGSGVNQIYLSATTGVRSLNCGGNPATVVYVNRELLGPYSLQMLARDRARGCARFEEFDGAPRITAEQATPWGAFALVGGPGRDKLFGGHGGGTINGGEGDNELWADQYEQSGLPRSRGYTTTITAGNGDNRVFGGRGKNLITLGSGDNFVRGGEHRNVIFVGSGANRVLLRGAHSRNRVIINGAPTSGDGSYVESLANGRRPRIRCINGAKAAVVYGNTKPKTNCRPLVPIRSKRGKAIQLEHAPGTPAADPVVDGQLQPGQYGIGVPRPTTA